ncbi:MAG: macro domain-containing protein [Hadesarchaea archaeon]|nr:macro domain-containing protein [Hadesarchaea archaeon]
MVKLGNVKISVKCGDLTSEEVDAICNPANSLMIMGGGVAGAIKRTGGEEIEREARKHAPVSVGNAIATTAGKLKVKWVIHAPTMERPAMRTTSQKVYSATLAALKCAESIGATSIALPGMGTGIGGVPHVDAARAMIQAIKDFGFTASSLRKVILCDVDQEMVKAWMGELSQ